MTSGVALGQPTTVICEFSAGIAVSDQGSNGTVSHPCCVVYSFWVPIEKSISSYTSLAIQRMHACSPH